MTTPSEGEAMRWQCPQCGYSVTPNEILSVRKHFSAHALECVRCLYRTETKGTWDEAIAAYRRAAAQTSGVRARAIEECAKCIPTTWLDPLLTGPKAVAGVDKLPNPPVERLLQAIVKRIRALSPPREGEK